MKRKTRKKKFSKLTFNFIWFQVRLLILIWFDEERKQLELTIADCCKNLTIVSIGYEVRRKKVRFDVSGRKEGRKVRVELKTDFRTRRWQKWENKVEDK